ncbi:polyhydroxyalkanoic acid system family protein [Actimicrobium antarcticum]|uniref:Polyhydroxyalkanoic acid system protein n=1 Tax=Actimicrobium antarcticum TaxID=1051899 RepID=A0ABP7SYT9_9BURK
MADISIIQSHQMSKASAMAAAQSVADKMASDYDITSTWEGNVLSFNRSGVAGTLAIDDTEARLDITLGFMLKSFAPIIQEKVTRNMAKVFAIDA